MYSEKILFLSISVCEIKPSDNCC